MVAAIKPVVRTSAAADITAMALIILRERQHVRGLFEQIVKCGQLHKSSKNHSELTHVVCSTSSFKFKFHETDACFRMAAASRYVNDRRYLEVR